MIELCLNNPIKFSQRGYLNLERARVSSLVHKSPGLTTEQLKIEYFTRYREYPSEIENLLTEAKKLGWIASRFDQSNAKKLHWWPIELAEYGNNPTSKEPSFSFPKQKPIIQEPNPEFRGGF